MSSIDDGCTEISPRSVLIIVGKKQRTAAIAIFETGFSSPNQLLVIGAKAMIGIALAAIAIRHQRGADGAEPREEQRRRGCRAPAPIAKPPSASLSV